MGFRDGRSPSGKAPAFGAGIEGSNPSRPASFSCEVQVAGLCDIDLVELEWRRSQRDGAPVFWRAKAMGLKLD